MRIAIDARMMGPLTTRGIGRYIEELVRGLLALQTDDRLVLLVRDPSTSPFVGHPRVEHVLADIPWYGLSEQLRMSDLFRQARADIVHVPHWNVPLTYRGSLVLTIHDLLLRHQPLSAKASTKHPIIAATKQLGFRLVVREAIRHARIILTPTEFVAQDVQHFYNVPSSKIVVTGEGISDLPSADLTDMPAGRFLLYVGSAYPHKRLDLLLKVWSQLSDRFPSHELVIAGEEDVFMSRLVASVTSDGKERVRFLGRVSDGRLAGLYDRADGLIFPSSHEGFGLPPLEALGRGCPVIASDIPSLMEVLPKVGTIFFRDGDASGMMEGIDTLLRNQSVFKAAAMENREALKQKWSWEAAARKTRAAYERIDRSPS